MKVLALAPMLLAGCLADPAPPACKGPPQPITELNTGNSETGPWLAPDRLEMFFVSNRGGGNRIFHAARGSVTEPFNEIAEVPGLPDGQLFHPFVEADGLTLWFALSNGQPFHTLWKARREAPQAITFDPAESANVGGPILGDGGHPTMTADRLTLIFHAQNVDGRYRLFRARRDAPASDAWTVEPLDGVIGTLPLVFDPSISASGDRLLFSASENGALPFHIFESDQLGTTYEPGVLEEDTGGGDAISDDEPSLHIGGDTIVFSSDRAGGDTDIYMACP